MALIQRSGHVRRESGQVAVETALIIPLFVFLILGVLQLGLMAQARVMAKYAAYRAARVGAMNHASVEAMEAAAVFHLLPVLATEQGTILPTGSSSEVISKYTRALTENTTRLAAGSKQVKVVICGPTISELRGTGRDALSPADQQSRGGRGSRNEVDFDDPELVLNGEVSSSDNPDDDGSTGLGGDEMRRYNRLRLRVQLQLLYRMPIPFANWIMTRTYLGLSLPSVLMMTRKGETLKERTKDQAIPVRALLNQRIYTIPINVSYAMRMQSNFFLNRFKLPDRNECYHYAP
ncbi:pilus assembly protein [Archangium violaceum]|uniref:TadE family protein n=1 Tax=Archangium violaceum TaxID=83451 RepID=UPI00193C4EEA|nr:TadE family protein [Archangium violaceum]QRK08211.1 pilus assembly protein [Archangium violaceum]